MKRLVIIGGALAAACCTTSSTKGPDSDRRTGDSHATMTANGGNTAAPATSPKQPASAGGKRSMTTTPASTVTLSFASQTRTRPPSSTLVFNATVANPRKTARWFLLPATSDASDKTMDSAVSGVSAKLLAGTGRVVLGNFTGLPGFHALLVPANGHLEIAGLPMHAASAPGAGPRDFSVIVCDTMTVGGEPARAWFKTDPLSDATAKVNVTGATLAGTRDSPGYKAVPVVVSGDVERLTVTVQLPKGL